MAKKKKRVNYTLLTYWLWHYLIWYSMPFPLCHKWPKDCQNWGVNTLQKISRQPKFCQTIFLTPDLWLYWWCTIIIFFPPHYGPEVDSATNGNEYYKYFLRVKGSQCTGLTTLPTTFADCLEIWDPQPPRILYRDCFTLLYHKNTLFAAVAGSSYIAIDII